MSVLSENISHYKKIRKLKIKEISLFSKLKHPAVSMSFLFAILAAAFSALPNVIPKSLMGESVTDGVIVPNPLMLVFVIYVVNSLLFSPFRRIYRKPKVKKTETNKTRRATLVLLILLGVAEASGTIRYTVGLEDSSATNASILVNSETIFAILLGIMIFKEKLSRQERLPFLLIVVGSILIPIGADIHNNNWQLSDFMVGDFLIVMSELFYCLDTFIAKKLDSSVTTTLIAN